MKLQALRVGRYLILLAFGMANVLLFQNCSNWEGKVVVTDRVDMLSTDEQISPISNPNTSVDSGSDNDLVDVIRVAECLPNEISSEACSNNSNLANKLICKVGKFVDENGIDDCLETTSTTNPCSADKIYIDGMCTCHPGQQLSSQNICYTPAADICADSYALITTTTATITFEDNTRATCDWGNDGNFLKPDWLHNNLLSARYEQSKTLSLPQGATVCDMSFEFKANQDMRYDDHVIMTYNDIVFSTTHKNLLQYLDNKGTLAAPLYQYNWFKLVGNGTNSAYADSTSVMCLDARSGSQCSWPRTEQAGAISMTIDPSQIQKISDLSVDRANKTFGFITVGDNDNTDCRHSPISFTVLVKYATAR